jgi:hypothetical protein
MGLADLVVVWLTLRLPFLPFFVFSLELYSYLLIFLSFVSSPGLRRG